MAKIIPKLDFRDPAGAQPETEDILNGSSRDTFQNALSPLRFNEYDTLFMAITDALGDPEFSDIETTIPGLTIPIPNIGNTVRAVSDYFYQQTEALDTYKYDKTGGTITGGVVISGDLRIGNSIVFVDSDTSRTGFGTNEPTVTMDVRGDGYVSGNITIVGTINSNGALVIPRSSGAAPTVDGQTAWNSSAKTLNIGTGSTTRTMVDTTSSQNISSKTISSSTITGSNLTNIVSLVPSGDLNIGAHNLTASRFISSVAQGTSPLGVTSTTVVSNLNADMIDGRHIGTSGDGIPILSAQNTWDGIQAFNGGTSGASSPFTVDSTYVVSSLNADMVDAAHKSIDGTFASNSDLLIPTEKAAKTYIDYAMRYDYVVDSPAKFNALVASGTWLNAKNVLFTTDVTRAAQTTIPATVEKIHAINGAKLTVTNLTSGQYGFGYATVPTNPKFEIRNFTVNATGSGTVYGFCRCTQLTGCTGTGNGTGYGYGFDSCNKLTNCTGTGTGTGTGYGHGFNACIQLTNCTGTGTGAGTGAGIGFVSCHQLTNCTGTGTGAGTGIGFVSCHQLTNCTGTGTSTGTGAGNGYGFSACHQLTNCNGTGNGAGTGTGVGFVTCTQLTNCTGTGTGTGTGYGHGFNACTQLTNCTGTGTGGTGYGYRDCKKCMCNRATGTTDAYHASHASADASYACADTAAGGYNS